MAFRAMFACSKGTTSATSVKNKRSGEGGGGGAQPGAREVALLLQDSTLQRPKPVRINRKKWAEKSFLQNTESAWQRPHELGKQQVGSGVKPRSWGRTCQACAAPQLDRHPAAQQVGPGLEELQQPVSRVPHLACKESRERQSVRTSLSVLKCKKSAHLQSRETLDTPARR